MRLFRHVRLTLFAVSDKEAIGTADTEPLCYVDVVSRVKWQSQGNSVSPNDASWAAGLGLENPGGYINRYRYGIRVNMIQGQVCRFAFLILTVA